MGMGMGMVVYDTLYADVFYMKLCRVFKSRSRFLDMNMMPIIADYDDKRPHTTRC